ncbi:MAG: XdhC family protein, partial [Pseudomonadota bacterium]
GVEAGAEVDGIRFENNGCPSRGSIDIFIEPFLPVPVLTVVGASPVARALADLAPAFHWSVGAGEAGTPGIVVIATQGRGDLDALEAALAAPARLVAFVGSRRKFEALAATLAERGVDAARIAAVRAPAGLDIGAVTPEEIALSILAELVQHRRSGIKRPSAQGGCQPEVSTGALPSRVRIGPGG